ncbi:DsbA family protein [Gemmatimonas sp.]|uniref:DsbA family protein n=1 Tax=Gemmatimonas sp. TaxID=1962908 RepID=UPI003983C544
MGKQLDGAINLLLGLSALAILARVSFGRGSDVTPTAEVGRAISKEDWSYAVANGVVVSGSSAPVRMVVFTDFECPFCTLLHERIVKRMQMHSGVVSVAVLHFAIASHRFAKQAATAFDCAESGAVKARMMDLLDAKQDSIGLLTWSEMSRRAGERDTIVFERCMSADAPMVAEHLRFGERLGIRATPTVLVDGIRFEVPLRTFNSMRSFASRTDSPSRVMKTLICERHARYSRIERVQTVS